MRPSIGRLLLAVSLTTPALAGSGCAYLRNSQSSLEQAQAALEAGDEAKAEAIYREAMTNKRDKDRVEAQAMLVDLLIRRGARLLEAGQADDAIGQYREALALDPSHDVSRISYARALMRVERFTEAIDVLMAGKGCRGCKSLISVIYLERAASEVRNGNYADALVDYDLALSMSRDPMTVLAKVDVYTVGQHGTASDAVAYLDHALRLIPPDQAGIQRLWWDKRMAVLYAAAKWTATRW
jgi:tetratricopeptide (TPR) repeat protein